MKQLQQKQQKLQLRENMKKPNNWRKNHLTLLLIFYLLKNCIYTRNQVICMFLQGVVILIRPVEPSVTGIKIDSSDQEAELSDQEVLEIAHQAA